MHVSLISDEKIEELTQGKDYTVTDRVVTLAAPTALKIKIYRQTATKPLVGWADASVLRAADMTVQSTQLLHLAEETSDLAQEGGLSKDGTDNIWDARYNKIKNLLDPTDPGDAVNLNYITKNQTSLLTQLNNTGAAQNASIVSTGDTQNARLTATGDKQNTRLTSTGDTQNKRLTDTGDKQNTRLTSTGDTQNKRLTDTGDSYVATMTTLKNTTTDKATEATNQAALAKKWAVSDTSPDGATDSKSAKTWAENAKASASSSASSANASASSAAASQTSASSSASSASTASQKATAASSSASSASSSASNAATSATNAKTSETNAAKSAAAAAQSAIDAAKFDPSSYYLKSEVDNKIGAVWDEPLNWSQLEDQSAVNKGRLIVYDAYGNPWLLEYGFLQYLINNALDLSVYALKTAIPTKTSQLTNDSGFAVISNGHLMINGSELWIE